MIGFLRALRVPLGLLVGIGLALAGCAGGNTRYACAGYPSQPLCLPPSAIYALAEGQGPAPAAEARPSALVGAWDRAQGRPVAPLAPGTAGVRP